MDKSDRHERALQLAFFDKMIRAASNQTIRSYFEQQRREAVEKNRRELAGK